MIARGENGLVKRMHGVQCDKEEKTVRNADFFSFLLWYKNKDEEYFALHANVTCSTVY